MDFLILRPVSPKTGYHFFEGGVGGWGGGGSKVFAEKAASSGEGRGCRTTAGRMVTQQGVVPRVVGSNPGLGILEPPTKKSITTCITIRPLLEYQDNCSPLLAAVSATDKKPKLCVSV